MEIKAIMEVVLVENMKREVVLTREDIEKKTLEMGEFLTKEYEGKNLLVISLLKGSFIFTADLVRKVKLPLVIEFMVTSSYLDGFESTGKVNVIKDVDVDIKDYDVLVVDDIIDSGNTMKAVYELLSERSPRSLKTCTLLDKPSRRKVEFEADYVGFVIPDKFIVGYGLNYGNYFRNEDHIFAFVE